MRITGDSNEVVSGRLPRALYKLVIKEEPVGSVSKNGNRMFKLYLSVVDIMTDNKQGLEGVIGTPITDYILVEQGKHQKLEQLLKSLNLNINNVEFNEVTGEPTYEVDDTTGASQPIVFAGKEVYAICESIPKPLVDEFGNQMRAPDRDITIQGYQHRIVRYV